MFVKVKFFYEASAGHPQFEDGYIPWSNIKGISGKVISVIHPITFQGKPPVKSIELSEDLKSKHNQ